MYNPFFKYLLILGISFVSSGTGLSTVVIANDSDFGPPPSRPVRPAGFQEQAEQQSIQQEYDPQPDGPSEEIPFYDQQDQPVSQQPKKYATREDFIKDIEQRMQSCPDCNRCMTYEWQCLPDGLIYKSYLAGPKEPRFATAWLYESDRGWVWDTTLGGRVGLIRYGTDTAVRPRGWQFDIEGAAFPRLDMDYSEDLESVDFRIGFPLTWSNGPYQIKFGYYHISAHVGDEYMERNPTFQRVNYVRDSLVLGIGHYVTGDVRIYGETAYAFNADFAEPWEFQFGAEYSPRSKYGQKSAPFFAINAMLFEEHNFSGNTNIMTGWQWRGRQSDRLLRLGLQYFNGKSSQYAFYTRTEELLGFGVWLDY